MSSFSDYYEKRLYPLQDGVLKCVAGCGAEFFLTGGTALNRGFHNRRYSDDLDFFLSERASFIDQVEIAVNALDRAGYKIDKSSDALKTADYCTFVVYAESKPGDLLKLDFVNDVAAHFGGIVSTELFPKTDSLRNILSNKLTALSRFEAKDVADIHTICAYERFLWPEIADEAKEKEAGFEAPVAAEILVGIPQEDFLSIRWLVSPAWDSFRRDLEKMAEDIIRGDENSLCAGRK